MFSQKAGSSEQTSSMRNNKVLAELRYAPAHRRRSKFGLTTIKRTAVLGLGMAVTGACATTAVTNASAKKPAKVVAKGASAAKKPKAGKPTPTTITYRVPTTVGAGITPASVKAPAAPVEPAADPVAASAPVEPAGKGDCRVMPLGDSLTAFAESYRGPLFRTLKSEGLKVDFVGSGQWEPVGGGDPDGEGHGGFRIGPDEGVDYQGKPAHLDAYIVDWLKSGKPDVILLNIGTNDLAAGGNIAAAAPGKLQNLVAKIRQVAPDAYVVVSDIPPNTNATSVNPQVRAVGDAIKKVADGSDPRVLYGDTTKRLLDAGFTTAAHTSDGTHFTVDGGVLFARAWYPKTRAAIKAACGM
jgi:GDSL-like Lipase/Acylhydrolase family